MNKSLPTTELRSHQLKYKILMLVLLCAGYAHAQIMSSSGNPALEGQPVTFTVEIDAPSGVTATPTGTITFTDNDQNIGTAPVQNGTALFTTQFTGTGDHIIVADYSGDTNFTPSSSPPFTEHISADDVFTLSVSPSLITQHAGDSSTLNVTVFGSGDNGPVRFSCENLPAGATCSFQPDSVVPSPQGASATATVSTASKARRASRWSHSPVLYAGFFMPFVFLRRRRRFLSVCILSLTCMLFAIGGCGGKVRVLEGGTPAGIYTVHVTATDGNTTQKAEIRR